MTTASLVTYKTPQSVVDRLRTATLADGVDEFIVVDNTVDNVGFGAGHNKAIREAGEKGSKYHFIINPDIFFEPGTLKKIVAFMDENPRVGLLMPKTVNVDGSIQYNCKLVPSPMDLIGRRFLPRSLIRRKNDYFEMKWADYEKTMEVPYLCGCFMCFRMEALRDVGLFDEHFFMYPEDIDISRRMWSCGWHPTYFPGATVTHAHEGASYKSLKMLRIHMWNMVKYFNKWGWFFDAERHRINEFTIFRCSGETNVSIDGADAGA
jgi:GT2 family glycosyltransferase